MQPRNPPEAYEGAIQLQLKLLRDLHMVTADIEKAERGLASMEGVLGTEEKKLINEISRGQYGTGNYVSRSD